jgi:hypothetical protein
MKKLFIALILLSATSLLRAEYLFMKNGSIIKCKVIVEEAYSITVREEGGSVKTYPSRDVMRVLYTELNMGKVYVKLKNGGSLLAYHVDEDRTTYIFRKELYKPEEVKIERADVLFMADRNPSSLKGTPETDRISLEWFPPYDPMLEYRIYWKKTKEAEYELAHTISGESAACSLKNLPSNTSYLIRVVGIDHMKEETLPSNEIEVVTKNIVPGRPVAMRMSGAAESGSLIEWDPAIDPDGTIKEYLVSMDSGGDARELGRSGLCSYRLAPGHKSFSYSVSAVDDRGDESGRSGLHGIEVQLNFQPSVIIPAGEFGSLFAPGYGAMLSVAAADNFFYIDNITAAVDLGYFSMEGVHEHMVQYGMLPVLITGGYRFRYSGRVIFKPSAGLGFSWIWLSYLSRGAEGADLLSERETGGADFTFRLSAAAEYILRSGIILTAGIHYGALVESSGLKSFVIFSMGAGYLL